MGLKREERKSYLPERKRIPTGDQDFYKSKLWTRTAAYNKMMNPLCEACLKLDKVTGAEETDHIVPLPFGARIDERNLMSLCKSHHSLKSKREQNIGILIESIESETGLIPLNREEIFKIWEK